MGTVSSKRAAEQPLASPSGAASTTASAGADSFDANDLLRALQEQEGYEVYDVFERPSDGGRLPAPIRLWVEAVEGAATPDGGSSGDAPRRGADDAASPATDDSEPWVLLTTASSGPGPAVSAPPASAAGKGKGKGPPPPPGAAAGKGKGPPLPAGKGGPAGKGPPPPSKGKAGAGPPPAAKKAARPPPFGKKLHWKLLPATSLGDTIFEELRPWGEVAQPLDTQQLERLLAPPAPAPAAAARAERAASSCSAGACGAEAMAGRSSGGRGSAGGGGGGSGKICLLDDRRAQNLAIVLRQVSMKTEDLAEVLRWMRLSHPVTADELEHICDNLLPPLLESPELAEYSGPPEDLRIVERQLLPLVRLPRLKARLQTLLFSKNIPVQHRALQARIHGLQSACKQVRSSPALRRVLGTVLRVGNYLNHGVDAPDAGCGVEVRGFAIESLLKLRDFRAAQSGEVHALHCVVLHLLPAESTLPSQLRAELRNVLELPGGAQGGGSAGLSEGWISDLRDAVGSFQSETDLVQGEIERFADCYRWDGEAHHEGPGPLAVLQRLVEDAGELARGLEAELGEARMAAWKLLEYFGERRGNHGQPVGGWGDEAYQIVETFFSTIREFVLSFEECWKDVRDQPRKFSLDSRPAAPGGGAAGGPPTGSGSASPPARRAAQTGAPQQQPPLTRRGRDASPPECKSVPMAPPRKLPPPQAAPLGAATPPQLAGFGAVAAAAAAAAAAGRAAKDRAAAAAGVADAAAAADAAGQHGGAGEGIAVRRRRPRAPDAPARAPVGQAGPFSGGEPGIDLD